MNRCDFLTATMTRIACVAATSIIRTPVWAQTAAPAGSAATTLKAATRRLDINGKAASVYGLVQSNGAPGVTLNSGEAFDVSLSNELSEPTLIHWHGLTPPWPLDGVPDTPAPPPETR